MRLPIHFAVKAISLLSVTTSIQAFWRMGCRARAGLARIDPLVSYGTLSDHAHVIHGSSGFSANAGYEQLMAGRCTSCEVAEDKSAYWTPALYFQDSSGKYTLVEQVGGMLAYYLLYPNAGNKSISSFPAGFEMIAGDTRQRNFTYPVPDIDKSNWNVAPYNTQAFLRQAALGFNCLDYSKPPEGSLYRHFLPDNDYLSANCPDGVRFELMFPSCWNGQKDTPANKQDHVAYPSEVMTGECPEGFSERLPSLFYETIWNTYAFKGQSGQFVLSNGDPTGYGYHGDFIMGWDEKLLQEAVNTCTNPSGKTSDCPLFTLQDASAYDTCNMTELPVQIVHEKVEGALTALPGNPPIQYGPAYASEIEPGMGVSIPVSVPNAIATPITHVASSPQAHPAPESIEASPHPFSAGSATAPTNTVVPGAVFKANPAPVSSASSSMITSAPDYNQAAVTDTRSFFSTEYKSSNNNVVEVLWVEEVVTVSSFQTVTIEAAAPSHKRSHMQKHRRRLEGGNQHARGM